MLVCYPHARLHAVSMSRLILLAFDKQQLASLLIAL